MISVLCVACGLGFGDGITRLFCCANRDRGEGRGGRFIRL